jgi:hypothetical protein
VTRDLANVGLFSRRNDDAGGAAQEDVNLAE